MLRYSESVYSRTESDKETMLSDLARFVLEHSKEENAAMYKRTTYSGNVKIDRYVFDENVLVSYSEFYVETESYYNREIVTWWNCQSLEKKYYVSYIKEGRD